MYGFSALKRRISCFYWALGSKTFNSLTSMIQQSTNFLFFFFLRGFGEVSQKNFRSDTDFFLARVRFMGKGSQTNSLSLILVFKKTSWREGTPHVTNQAGLYELKTIKPNFLALAFKTLPH
mmetsp:Transcript_32535/g.127599  ORF Transcript_32535/g.127599 Transcript_32535/m.127599 type:complete len:121 (+) Transcript_32535:1199-1561(+)